MGLAILIGIGAYVIADEYMWYKKKKRWLAYSEKINKKIAKAKKT